jgi:hypothetical protein
MAKTKSFGTAVTVGATAITGLTDINISGGDVPFLDITTHDSTAKEFVAGLVDYGTLALTGKLNTADSGQDALRSGTGTSAAFVVTLPNAATISFSAIIGVMDDEIPLEGTVGFSISCKLTGAKTYSA